MTRKLDQIRGGFLGAASGDALGYCVQEMTMEDIYEQFGPDGLQGYDMLNGYAQFSANTQTMLFTANGILHGATRGAMRGIMAPYASYLRLAYQDWLTTQSYGRRGLSPGRADRKRICWLCQVDQLHARRAPDRATMLALEQERVGTMDDPISHARGAAGLARSVSVGMYAFGGGDTGRQEAVQVAAESAALTHGDPAGFLPSAYLADLLHRLCYEKPVSFRALLNAAREDMTVRFGSIYPEVRKINGLLRQAENLADSETPPAAVMDQLHPEDAEGVLAAACYVCLKFPGDFDRGIVAAVNHSYDSAATGTVAGALLGASVGTEGIPEFYLEPLELRSVIETLADDLYQGCPMGQGSLLFDDEWNDKYIECTPL